MQFKTILQSQLSLADALSQKILNPEGKRRYRTFAYVKKQYAREPSLFIGAYDGEKLIGITFGYIKKNTVLLGEMAIDKNHRGKGIGSKLLQQFEERVHSLGKTVIELGAQERAEEFYMKNNYEPILFVQIKHAEVPKNYQNLPFEIIKETNFPDAKRLFIKATRPTNELKSAAEKAFHAYNVIYLFRKILS